MKTEINPRGNGACPICRFNGKCPIQENLSSANEDLFRNEELTLVVYTCPKFEENTNE